MLVLRAVDGANRVSPFVLVILLLPFVGGFAQGNFRPLVAYLVWITFDSRTKDWKGAQGSCCSSSTEPSDWFQPRMSVLATSLVKSG